MLIKCVYFAVTVFGLIPVLFGLLYEMILLLPLRVPLHHTPVLLLWQVSAKLLLCFTLPYFFCGRYLQSYYCVLHSRTSSVAGICKVIIVFYTPVLLLWQVSAKLLLCFTLPYFFCDRYLQSYYCVLHSRTSSVAGICKVIIVFYTPVLLLWQVSAKLLLCFTLPYFFCGRYLQSFYCVLHSRTSSVAGICKVIICFTLPYFFCGRYLQSYYCVLHSRTSSVTGICKVIICFTLPYFFCGRYLQSYYLFYTPVLLLWQVSAKLLFVLHSRTSSVAGICKVIIVFYTPVLLL